METKKRKAYKEPDCLQFVKDMGEAGLSVRHYEGRFFWKGPGVIVSDISDVLQNTKVKCQWDNMGRDFIVYPRRGER